MARDCNVRLRDVDLAGDVRFCKYWQHVCELFQLAPTEARLLTLYALCRDQIVEQWREAVEQKTQQPVVFLADCESLGASPIARRWLPPEKVQQLARTSRRSGAPGATVTLADAVDFEQAKQIVLEARPGMTGLFERPPEADEIAVIVIVTEVAATFRMKAPG